MFLKKQTKKKWKQPLTNSYDEQTVLSNAQFIPVLTGNPHWTGHQSKTGHIPVTPTLQAQIRVWNTGVHLVQFMLQQLWFSRARVRARNVPAPQPSPSADGCDLPGLKGVGKH